VKFIDLNKQYQRIEGPIKARIEKVLEHGQYIMGPEISELESALCDYVGVSNAVCVSSGTDALLLALMALEIGPGDEVITTPFSFFASVEVICLLGATPVFVDIEPDTFNLDPSKLKAAISDKTKAIMPVSLYGQCAEMDEINAIAVRHQLPVIEDAAQSFGASYKGKKSGALSTIACTSFFPSKPLGAYGDAGACFTNDETIANRLRELLNHGQSERYLHTRIGLNGRMDSIQAAILIEKLGLLDDELEKRTEVATFYQGLLNGVATAQTIREDRTSAYAQFTIMVPNRPEVQRLLSKRGIPTAVHYPVALHQQPALAYLNIDPEAFPVVNKAASQVISLPMHPYLEKTEQEKVVCALQDVLESLG
jgi:UDP-2-acetamido-2-deoxy-ribo-hexuluronate aminotransferase